MSENQLDLLANRLRVYSAIFKSGKLDEAALWLSSTADRVSSKDLVGVWDGYKKAYAAVRHEFSNGNSKLEDLFDEIIARMPVIPSGCPLSAFQMEDVLADTINAQKVLVQIVNVFNSASLTVEQHFYGLCFQYMILVEGIYDQALRYLLLWWDNTKGQTPKVQEMLLSKVKEKLESRGAQAILFEGWEPRIRNSIAHARFSYDEKVDRAIFDDVKPNDPADKYHREMNYKKFGEMGMGLYNVVFLTELVLVMGHLVPLILRAAEA